MYKKVHTTEITTVISLASNTLEEFIFIDDMVLIMTSPKKGTQYAMVFDYL